jgi:hypothetical protein
MALMTKQCNRCGNVKETTQFSKCSSNKDGLQYACKRCNSKTNLDFRTDKPEHHVLWQKNNHKQHLRNVARYRKADKNGLIYSITNPDGFVYIGLTQTHFSVRLGEHKKQYRRDKGNIPALHKSYDDYGYDNHKANVILELEGIDRVQLGFIETTFIQLYKELGKSLNIKIK